MLGGELSGDLEKLIITALQATQETFDPDYHTEARMKQETDRLYKMSQGTREILLLFSELPALFHAVLTDLSVLMTK